MSNEELIPQPTRNAAETTPCNLAESSIDHSTIEDHWKDLNINAGPTQVITEDKADILVIDKTE